MEHENHLGKRFVRIGVCCYYKFERLTYRVENKPVTIIVVMEYNYSDEVVAILDADEFAKQVDNLDVFEVDTHPRTVEFIEGDIVQFEWAFKTFEGIFLRYEDRGLRKIRCAIIDTEEKGVVPIQPQLVKKVC